MIKLEVHKQMNFLGLSSLSRFQKMNSYLVEMKVIIMLLKMKMKNNL